MMALLPLPGDFCCCDISGNVGGLIHLAQKLSGGHNSQYEHVFIYTGDGLAVEARPHGAAEIPCPTPKLQLWSTGIISLTPVQRTRIVTSARAYAERKVGYSYLDYLAIAAHQDHIPFPGLQDFISYTGHMICSQLVDQCYFNGQVNLFTDHRWPGYVRPSDMADVVLP
jgi:uncharacterized protein YycO